MPGKQLLADYGLRVPFVGAGMAFISTPPLVAAVSNAGGLGVLGVGAAPPPGLREMIRGTRALTSKPFGVDLLNATSAMGPFATDAHIEVCAAEQVPLVVFFWNTPSSSWVQQLHATGAKVWMQVGSVPEAVEAAEAGVDGIVAQGSEAGGHNKSVAPLPELLPAVINAVRPLLVLAAGGIASAGAASAALNAGADGVWVGTRLVASHEAYAHDDYKQRIIDAPSVGATARTTMFGPEWPGQPIRVLRNRIVAEWAGREDEIAAAPPPPVTIGTIPLGGTPYPMPKFSAMVPTPDTTGDLEEMCMPAGEGVARIDTIEGAADIVDEMMAAVV